MNTGYLMINYLIACAEAFEYPLFMHSFHVTRLLVVSAALAYDVAFIACVIEWANQLYLVGDKSEYDFFTVYINMLLGYNIAMHWPQVVVGTFIIFKETSMEFWQFLNPQSAGSENDEVALGLRDAEEAGEDFVWMINPLTWINMGLELFGMNAIEV